MKCFQMRRTEDETGVSGVGIVAEGVEFDNGKVALTWLANPLGRAFPAVTSVAIYDRMDDVILIHGHGGKTTIEIIGGGQITPYYCIQTSAACLPITGPDGIARCSQCGQVVRR